MTSIAITTADRGELVGLDDHDTLTYLGDAANWLRDVTAKGARAGATELDDWCKELDALNTSSSSLHDFLHKQDNWVAELFSEILSIIEVINPLSAGKQIAIWILEDFRDLLRSLATLVDTEDDTSEETEEAITNLALAAAALAIPYIGRAGKIVMRVFRGFDKLEDGLAMLRHLGTGNVVEYLQKLNLPQYASKIMDLIRRILGKVGDFLGRWLPKVKSVLDEWVTRISKWISNILGKIQAWIDEAIAGIQKKVFKAASDASNSKLLDKMPDTLLDWVATQINGNLCESCVDNFLINYMEYTRLEPKPGESKRDTSSFFGPDQGIDGLYEKAAHALTSPAFPANYSGIPLSLGWVLDELGIEIEGATIPKAISRSVKPFGNVKTDFQPITKRPPRYPRFVVMEAKFGFHGQQNKTLSNAEWEKKLGQTTSGRQMSRTWIEPRLDKILPRQADGTPNGKRLEIRASLYSRWLYGCQPHDAENKKRARARSGKMRLAGLAFFPPYALRGYDIDGMKWRV